MPDDKVSVSLRSDAAEAPATKREAPEVRGDTPVDWSIAPKGQPPRRRWVRRALFSLLPFALIAGAYEYVTGGQVMSTDDAYVEADKVGVSTDVSGIVKEIDVRENQHVMVGEVLYRLDDLPFQLALERAEAQIGMVRNDLNALKANYRDMQAQIKQGQYDVDYYSNELHRQQILVGSHAVSQAAVRSEERRVGKEC